MKKLVLGVLSMLVSLSLFAGTGTGKIVGYLPYAAGGEEAFFIKVENVSDTPVCNNTARFTMKSSDPKFRVTNAAVLAAFMAGTDVIARGLNTCNNFSNSEDLSYICLGNTPC